MKKSLLLGCLLFTLHFSSFSQVINSYAKVTSIAGTTLNLSNVNETNHTFEDGEQIIIMQMQDDVIGANTADNANFGDLSAIGSAGNFEVRTIASHTESLGVPTSVTVTPALGQTYNTSANSSVQIISFRLLSSNDYTTTMNMAALSWDGNVGGVIAFEVSGTLTLAHNVSANGAGFRGGARSANFYIGGTGCYNTPFRSNSTNHANKGEGIYKTTTANHATARAKILNGGGGGVQINAGGGGGGNFSAGGIGGAGWDGTAAGCSIAAGGYGYGGISLSAFITGTRIFMGGGGGGGQQNNSASTAGGNGGGIVLIKADEILTSGACGGFSITANGNSASIAGNDGAGGGGAAGSIVLEVNTFTISATCPLTIAANGGNGGSINTSTHAAGGAGGQGVVIFSGPEPVVNVTTTTNNGTAGCNNNSNPCNNSAGAASGTDNSGIIPSTNNSLPIELLSFNAAFISENSVQVFWQSANETNSDYFTVYKSKYGTDWDEVIQLDAAGNSNGIRTYETFDHSPYEGLSYYRLKQTDLNGDFKYYHIVPVEYSNLTDEYLLYPNPATQEVFISYTEGIDEILLVNIQGKMVRQITVSATSTSQNIPLGEISNGIYFIQFMKNNASVKNEKLVIQKE